jgi:hypothetical protein
MRRQRRKRSKVHHNGTTSTVISSEDSATVYYRGFFCFTSLSNHCDCDQLQEQALLVHQNKRHADVVLHMGNCKAAVAPTDKSCWQDGASRACSSSALWGVARSQPHWHRWAAPRHQPRRGHHLDNVPGSNAQDLGMALLHLERVYRSTSYCTLARPKPKKQRGLGMEQPGAPASFR